jgi:hypothetical protein
MAQICRHDVAARPSFSPDSERFEIGFRRRSWTWRRSFGVVKPGDAEMLDARAEIVR